ncbi:MAG: phosphomannomutase/phosphoglucomutase [Candidatus Kerfeldbacteria bacterium]|nr:phosphomannomutase/phosphoglucomutase [Candidatus Kerfeldbacteria bacterium]
MLPVFLQEQHNDTHLNVPPNIFRAYDLRGLVDKELNPTLVEHIGRAHGTFLQKRGIREALVARDFRASSPAYAEALIRGYVACGIDVIDIGLNLVGTFYWAQYYLKRMGGAMVSASHNPAEYNGFKFANGYSETLVSDGMAELQTLVETEGYVKDVQPGKVIQQDIRQAYISDLVKRLPIRRAFRVVVDARHATAGSIAPALLRQAGCDVIEYRTDVDPSFPLTADPTEHVVAKALRDAVLESNADIGFTYDPDGDRIGVVDEKGTIIWNDVLVALFAIDVLAAHPRATIMFNTLCSKLVPETIAKYGGIPFLWRTGHSFLKKKNQEVKAAFIGELSGHFFFSSDFYNHDDGLYSTLRLLHYLDRTQQTLSEALAKLPKYQSSPEIKLYCADEEKIALVQKMTPLFKRDYPSADIIDDERAGDGIRLELPDAMFVVRYSQNGPYLTIKFEANTPKRYDELRQYLDRLLHQFPEIDWSSKISVNLEALRTTSHPGNRPIRRQ